MTDLDEGDAVQFINSIREGDGDRAWPAGTQGVIEALSGRRGATYYRIRLDDGHLLRRDVRPSAVIPVPAPRDPWSRATHEPQHHAICEALVEGNGTHDCPACIGGQLGSGALCPLCEGWNTL